MAPNFLQCTDFLYYLICSPASWSLFFVLTYVKFQFSHKVSSYTKPKYTRASNTSGKNGFTISKPFILLGRISHTRLFPKFHAFSYSYLMVGIPVRATSSNWLLSVDSKEWWKRGWLQVQAEDHLGRGNNENGINQKLDQFLESQVRAASLASNLLEAFFVFRMGDLQNAHLSLLRDTLQPRTQLRISSRRPDY